MKNYFDKGTPLTISMWDYSLLKCSHPGGSFHDLSRCVAKAAERGYNTMRIDAFPHGYPNALLAHIDSYITYLLDGAYARFTATIGLHAHRPDGRTRPSLHQGTSSAFARMESGNHR